MTNTPNPLTVVMYHYVRDLPRTRYPKIKGLLTSKFLGQLDYLQKWYTIVSVQEVAAACETGGELPPRPCLLTFDDGFIDHYVTVYPLLEERGLSAGFFPPAEPIIERRLADAHKLHLALATLPEGDLPKRVLALLAPFRKEYQLPCDQALYQEFATNDPFDPPEIMFVKRLLNRGLPSEVGSAICDQLFREAVSEDEETIAQELYMDLPQLRCMARNGMYIGGHGYKHQRLGLLSEGEQREDIQRTIGFLTEVYGQVPTSWVLSYPFGDHSDGTAKLLREANCSFAMLANPALVEEELFTGMEMPRLDTNDLPFHPDAGPSVWTQKVAGAAGATKGVN